MTNTTPAAAGAASRRGAAGDDAHHLAGGVRGGSRCAAAMASRPRGVVRAGGGRSSIETEERGFAGRIRTILAEEQPQFMTWVLPPLPASARTSSGPCRASGGVHPACTAGIAIVEALTATDLDRGGYYPEVGFLTVNDLLHEWIHHDANHLRQMLANVQSYIWPSMGNAQRFSAPDSSPSASAWRPEH